MDAYMECLYDYITKRFLDVRLRDNPEYRRLAGACFAASSALEALLSPEQSRFLDRLQSAKSDMRS